MLRAWEIGSLSTPLLEVRYMHPGDTAAQTLAVQPISIEVRSVLINGDLSPRPLPTPIPLGISISGWVIPVTVVSLSVIILGIALGVALKVRARRAANTRKLPIVTRVQQLRVQTTTADQKMTQLVSLLRTYLAQVYAIKADVTPDELLHQLAERGRPSLQAQEQLRNILQQADEIRFGNSNTDNVEQIFQKAVYWVDAHERLWVQPEFQ